MSEEWERNCHCGGWRDEGEDREGGKYVFFSAGSRGRRLCSYCCGLACKMATVIETKDGQMVASSTPTWKNYGLTGRCCDRGGEGYVIISDINDIPSLSAASESITNHRRKKNTGHIL